MGAIQSHMHGNYEERFEKRVRRLNLRKSHKAESSDSSLEESFASEEDYDEVDSAILTLLDVPLPKTVSNFLANPVARIFISSTFKDFFYERDYLVKNVFSELREWCFSKNVVLLETDLRWGIPANTAPSDIINTCLNELDCCMEETGFQPFFLSLLGQRYGWIPTKEDITNSQFDSFWIPSASITSLEVFRGVIWPKSNNGLILLRSKECFENLPSDFDLSKYVDDDDENYTNFHNLLRRHLPPEQLIGYSPKVELCDGKIVICDLEEIGAVVMNFFKRAISHTFSLEDDLEQSNDEQKLYFDVMDIPFFIGQEAAFSKLKGFIEKENLQFPKIESSSSSLHISEMHYTPESNFLCLLGESGTGKTTLMVQLIKYLLKRQHTHTFYYFCDFNSHLCNERNILIQMLLSLADFTLHDASADELEKLNFDVLIARFNDFLVDATKRDKLCVFVIDAVNIMNLQPSDLSSKPFKWLPTSQTYSSNIKFVFSSTFDEGCLSMFSHHNSSVVELQGFDETHAQLFIKEYFSTFSKSLSVDQEQRLLSKSSSYNILWLNLVCDELRLYGNFELLDNFIDNIPADISKLLYNILQRIFSEDSSKSTKQMLLIVALSVHGIPEIFVNEIIQQCIPNITQMELARARRQIKHLVIHFKPTANQLVRLRLRHQHIITACREILAKEDEVRSKIHFEISNYFMDKISSLNTRYLAEILPEHLIGCKRYKDLIFIVTASQLSSHISAPLKSRYLQHVRCKQIIHMNVHNFTALYLCVFCQRRVDAKTGYLVSDVCPICQGYVHFKRAQQEAKLCQKHSTNIHFQTCYMCNFKRQQAVSLYTCNWCTKGLSTCVSLVHKV